MGTLWSELAPLTGRSGDHPRVYADANVPAGVVSFMRGTLGWDVLFVIEHPDLRRARDDEHFRLARRLRRTLVTCDRDYLDDRRFPPGESAGVLVVAAPHASALESLLARLDAGVFRGSDSPLPLDGRKLHAHSDWSP
jgi:predicted nuclease of predicted toxin-antitoxin system